MSLLQDKCGLEGYGFFWRVLEIIAGQSDGDKNFCQYSKRAWCQMLAINHQTWSKLIAGCEQAGLFHVSENEQGIRVESPNLLKYRDEWSRKKGNNSGVTPEPLRSKDPDPDQDPEKEKKEGGGDCARARVAPSMPEIPQSCAEQVRSTQPVPKKTDCPSKGHPEWRAFNSCYEVHPVKQGKEEAWREWMRLKENGTLAPSWVIRDAILRMIGEDSRWIRGKVPKMAKWLNGKGWNDEPFIEPDQGAGQTRDGPPVARTQHQKGRQDLEGLAALVLAADKEDFEHGFNATNQGRTQPDGFALPASPGPGGGTARPRNGLGGTMPRHD